MTPFEFLIIAALLCVAACGLIYYAHRKGSAPPSVAAAESEAVKLAKEAIGSAHFLASKLVEKLHQSTPVNPPAPVPAAVADPVPAPVMVAPQPAAPGGQAAPDPVPQQPATGGNGMEMNIEWKPSGNSDATTTGLKVDDQRIFNFVPQGNPGDTHIIQPYPFAGDYQGTMQWTLRGPGGAAGPKLWRQIGISPPCRMVIGESDYTSFGSVQTIAHVGVKVGETYAFCGVKDPNAAVYTGPQSGNSVVTLTNGG